MIKTKIFKCGNSNAVRIPKEFNFNTGEVEILKRGEEIIIRKVPKNLAQAFRSLTPFSDDFFAEGREDLPPQEREF